MKILLVERKFDNALRIQKIIKQLGITKYQEAQTYFEAIKIVNSNSFPDLIICNSDLFSHAQIELFSTRVKALKIPLLWIIESRKRVFLSYEIKKN